MKKLLVLLALGALVAGCSRSGPMERAGEDMDEALGTRQSYESNAEGVGEAIDDAAESTGRAVRDAVD